MLQKALRIEIDPDAAALEPCQIEQRAEGLVGNRGGLPRNYCFFALSFWSACAQPTVMSFLLSLRHCSSRPPPGLTPLHSLSLPKTPST
jgi:hypothetical protein